MNTSDTKINQLLSEALEQNKLGNLGASEHLCRQVLDLSPKSVNALHLLGILAQQVDNHSTAIELLQKAICIDPDLPLMHYNLALSYQHSGDLNSAISEYKIAISLDNKLSIAINNLGVVYQLLERHDEAIVQFQKAITLSPTLAETYYNLTISKKLSPDSTETKAIIQLLDNDKLATKEKSRMHFTLGNIYDDNNLYDDAFKHFSNANKLKSSQFNIDFFQMYIQNLISIFSCDYLSKAGNEHLISDQQKLVFIVGMPRSGATLIENAISSHSHITPGGELAFISEIVDNLIDILDTYLSYPSCIQEMSRDDFAQLANRIKYDIKKIFGEFLVLTDRTTANIFHIGFIHLLFPNSKIIHVKRNPIDTCLSCFFHNFNLQNQFSNNLRNIGKYFLEYQRIMAHWKRCLPNKIYEIEYENLINNSKNEIKKLIHACDLQWEELNSLHLDEDEDEGILKKSHFRKNLDNKSIEKWKNYEQYISSLLDIVK